PDVLLLGPQVRYLESDFKKTLTIPVAVINMQDYGLMKGDHVLQTALDLMV
ncbi:PTS sugar transporter subunit IIB, partial [Lactiplantibacillus plantarum]